MNNDISALNNYLFESIERLQDDSLDAETLDKEIKRADAVANTASIIIRNAELVLNAQKHMDEYDKEVQLRNPLLELGGG